MDFPIQQNICQNRPALIVASLTFLAAVAVIDSATGPEVYLSIFYLVPGAVVAWFAGKSAGIMIAVVSALAWLIVELNFGKHYQHAIVPYFNGFLQLVMSLFSSSLMATVRERELAMVEEVAARKKAELDLVLERALADAIETEQQRLGKDIHDGLGQHLVCTGFVASMLKTKLSEKGMPEAREAEELTSLVSDAIGQSRQLARGLFPVKLEAEGLVSALEELAENVSSRSKVACRFQAQCSSAISDPSLNLNLYRIAQEAVANALKHGAPGNILIRLHRDKARVEMCIQNDGKEYSPASGGRAGIGLRIMENRARLIGGKLRVEPGPSGGTNVQCEVPISPSPEAIE